MNAVSQQSLDRLAAEYEALDLRIDAARVRKGFGYLSAKEYAAVSAIEKALRPKVAA